MIKPFAQPFNQSADDWTYERVGAELKSPKSRTTIWVWWSNGRFPPPYHPPLQRQNGRTNRHLLFNREMVKAWDDDPDCRGGRTPVGPWLEAHGYTVEALEQAGYDLKEAILETMEDRR